MPDDDSPDPDYHLVMPFVVCQTHGGPYDDDSFCAGWSLAVLHERLALADQLHLAPAGGSAFDAATWPQIDLIAMRHRFTATKTDLGGGWITVDFHRATD